MKQVTIFTLTLVFSIFADNYCSVNLLNQVATGRVSSENYVFEQGLAILFDKGSERTGVEETEQEISYNLSQNYPNPFNPDTNIKFSIPRDQRVKIAVYNTNGELIKVVTDAAFKKGYHSVKFNGGDLSSGQYFYKMQAGSFTKMHKMIMVK